MPERIGGTCSVFVMAEKFTVAILRPNNNKWKTDIFIFNQGRGQRTFKSTKFLEDADEARHVSLLHSQILLLHSRDSFLLFP